MFTLDDACQAFSVSADADTYAGEELSHAQLTTLLERHGWQQDGEPWQQKSTPKGAVTKWLGERRIPMHPRTRRVNVDELIEIALTPGRLQPTSPQRLERQALQEQENLFLRCTGLMRAAEQAERLIAAHDRRRAALVANLERIEAQLAAAREAEQRLYDSGYRGLYTFARYDATGLDEFVESLS